MLASGPGKHDIYKPGHLLELDGLSVGLQPLMVVRNLHRRCNGENPFHPSAPERSMKPNPAREAESKG